MPEHPGSPPPYQENQEVKIRILQCNLNKSERAHLDIINEKVSQKYDVMLIQEPYTTKFNAIRTPANFRPVFPRSRDAETQVRSVIWVSKHLETKSWKILDIQNTCDITAIQLSGDYGKVTIINVYNDCTHARNEEILRNYLTTHRDDLSDGDNAHMIWAGDFNRHHPLWDDDKNTHLFTQQSLRNAEGIIELIAENNMEMALPKGIPTLQHMRTKRYSRPDNVFCSASIKPFVTKCEVKASERPVSTDHYPIETHINLPQTRIPPDPSYNFRTADWEEFRKRLTAKLDTIPQPGPIEDADILASAGDNLTKILQETIEEKITKTRPRPDAKRWWNGDLKEMRKDLNRLRTMSYHNRTIANHHSHRELRIKSRQYGKAIISAKRAHWTEYLEGMTADDIWTANKYIKDPVGDGGMPRIPTIKTKDEEGNEIEINNSKEKAKAFAKAIFPNPPRPR